MSKIEIAAIVAALLVPVIALVIMNPFKYILKKKTKDVKPAETLQEQKNEVKEDKKPDSAPKDIRADEIFETEPFKMSEVEEYKEYAKKKQKEITPPEFKTTVAQTMPYNEFNFVQEQKSKKPISKQIDELSPELKTLLFTGALSEKKYDD